MFVFFFSHSIVKKSNEVIYLSSSVYGLYYRHSDTRIFLDAFSSPAADRACALNKLGIYVYEAEQRRSVGG